MNQKKEILLRTLYNLLGEGDIEMARIATDHALMSYIDDPEIEKAIKLLWYN